LRIVGLQDGWADADAEIKGLKDYGIEGLMDYGIMEL
jgi:hypothetical protein